MKKILTVLFFIVTISLCSQTNEGVEAKLEELSKIEKGLNELVQVNVSQITLFEFITALSNEHKLNVSVDENLDQTLINNFYNVEVKQVFLFLFRKYDLDVQFLDKIIIITKKKEEKKIKKIEKVIDVKYDKSKKLLSLNVSKDTLFDIAKEITNKTGKNILVSEGIRNKKVTGYILNRSVDEVLKMLARSNNLEVTTNEEGYYYIDVKKKVIEVVKEKPGNLKGNKIIRKNDNLYAALNKDGTLNVVADEVPLIDVIYNVALKANKNYFLYSKIDNSIKVTFSVRGLKFEDLLQNLLMTTKYTFKKTEDYFLIGDKSREGMYTTKLIKLKNRTVENVLSSIPAKLSSPLEIKEFKDLNGLVVTGHDAAIQDLKSFIEKIDENVPVIQIEVIIVEYTKSHEVQTGIRAGIDKAAQSSLKSAFPTTDVTLNSSNINKLINAFNGLGIVNLGKVHPNFYLGLKALENNAIINLQSTPKIATLNGHEANIKIGSTDYYFEQTNRLLTNSQNSDVLQSGQWRPTEANLSLRIKPFVSKNETVTLDILVEKSAFAGRVGETAPPSKTTQQFESLIRIKNGEMILLGGLDEAEKSNSGTGTPLLSRIPIIKWLFSGRNKKKRKKKLHMFIKPTVYF